MEKIEKLNKEMILELSKNGIDVSEMELLQQASGNHGPEGLTEFFRRNCYLYIRKKKDDGSLRKDCLDLELYIRLRLRKYDGSAKGTVRMTPGLARLIGLTPEEIWAAAISNSRNSYTVLRLSCLLSIADFGTSPLYTVTTRDRGNGAAALYFPEIFRSFCGRHQEKGCYILPSSVEEVMVLPLSEAAVDAAILADMVDTINHKYVPEELQLNPVAYRYDLETDRVAVAAEAGKEAA